MTTIEQLEKWVNGISEHNYETGGCCPDGSCCGAPLAPEFERIAFKKAFDGGYQDLVIEMLNNFQFRAIGFGVNEDNVKTAFTRIQ